MLLGSAQVAFDRPGNYAIIGELALTGETRPVKGILSMALQAVSERRDGLLVPTANAAEATVVEGLSVYPVGRGAPRLRGRAEAVRFLSGQVDAQACKRDENIAILRRAFGSLEGSSWASHRI